MSRNGMEPMEVFDIPLFTRIMCKQGFRMKNITLALDEETIKSGRAYARRHNLTLNSLVRKLLKQVVGSGSKQWVGECFNLMDSARADSKGARWRREDLYRV